MHTMRVYSVVTPIRTCSIPLVPRAAMVQLWTYRLLGDVDLSRAPRLAPAAPRPPAGALENAKSLYESAPAPPVRALRRA